MPRKSPDFFLILVLTLSLILGALTLTDYGESWDDHSLRKYAAYSLRTYATWRGQGVMPITAEDLGNYGPAYVMTVALGARALSFLPLNEADIRHIFYLLTHLLGVWAFHQLGTRWLSQNGARFATLLYLTQPLLWGHAFMNPKDTPFLAFFLISVQLGLWMLDKLEARDFSQAELSSAARTLLTGGAFALAALYLAPQMIRAEIETLVRAAAAGQFNFLSLLASDIQTAAPEVYIQRYFTFFLWGRAAFFLLYALTALEWIPQARIVLPAALILGYTTSIRILAPFAGILVAFSALKKHGRRALFPLVLYGLVALAGMYITWPYLWSDPIAHLVESVMTMSQYPWDGMVLFNGVEYRADALPFSYLPTLLVLQFTEPIWVLCFFGALWAWKQKRSLLRLAVLWFALPLLGFIFFRVKLYDNFRQVLFILPPVFWLAGLGGEILLARLKQPALRVGAAALLLFPGWAAAIALHPYEYVYYNAFAPHPAGRFELDYWATSYREAMEYVNAVAPPNARVMAAGPGQVAELYAREDLRVLSDDEPTDEAFAYVILTTRYNFDAELYPQGRVVYTVARKGLPLAVVKRMP